VEKIKNKKDAILWISIVVLLLIAILVDHHYSDAAVTLRLAGWLVFSCGLVFVIAQTTQGKRVWSFAKEARTELRKVVWPTRQDTVRTTFMVIGLVLLAALFIWGVDSVLLSIINFVTI
jgi:preprotein translocase subunit SecE